MAINNLLNSHMVIDLYIDRTHFTIQILDGIKGWSRTVETIILLN